MAMKLGYTDIEYAVNKDGSRGRTYNFFPGCLHKPKGLCPVSFRCWAETMWKRQMGAAAKKGITLPDFHQPHLIPELLLGPLSVKKPSVILVNFMGDLFGDWVEPNMVIELTDQTGLSTVMTLKQWVCFVIRQRPQHTFLFLTKNPKGLIPWSPFPDNAWVGVSVSNQKKFDKALIYLSDVDAKLKWLSFEPLLENIIVSPIDLEDICHVVIGAQSSPAKYPDINWVENIVSIADKVGIPVWLKNNLSPNYYLRQERPF